MGAGEEERDHAAAAGDRNREQHDQHVARTADRRVDQEGDQQQGDGNDDHQPRGGLAQLVRLPRPLQMRVVRKRHLRLHPRMRVRDGGAEIASPHRELHRRIAAVVLAVDDGRPVLLGNPGQLTERNLRTVGCGNQDLPDGAEVLAVRLGPANDQVELLLSLVYLGDRLPPDGRLDDGGDVSDVQSISPAALAVRGDLHVGLAE